MASFPFQESPTLTLPGSDVAQISSEALEAARDPSKTLLDCPVQYAFDRHSEARRHAWCVAFSCARQQNSSLRPLNEPASDRLPGNNLSGFPVGQRFNAIDAEGAKRLTLFAPAEKVQDALLFLERLGFDVAVSPRTFPIDIFDVERPGDAAFSAELRSRRT